MSRSGTPNPYEPPRTDCSPAERDRFTSTACLEPPILVRGKLNREELEHSLTLAGGQRREPSKFWRRAGIVAAAAMGVGALCLIFEHPMSLGGYIGLLLVLAWLAYAIVIGPRAHRRLLDELEQAAQAADESQYALTTDAFVSRSVLGETKIVWEEMTGFHDSEQMILLRQNQDAWAIPRRWFAADEDFSRLVIFLGHRVEMLS